MAGPHPARRLSLIGAHNLRDIGGYPTVADGRTRRRTLFRADSLHRLSLDEQGALLEYGVRTVIDLRRPAEIAAATRRRCRVAAGALSVAGDRGGRAGRARARVRPRPTLPPDPRSPAGATRLVLATLAGQGAFPAVVHCTAGKDRTGLIVALLLGIAGVPHAQIVEDYALSATYLGEAFWAEVRARIAAAGLPLERYRPLLDAAPETMAGTLATWTAATAGRRCTRPSSASPKPRSSGSAGRWWSPPPDDAGRYRPGGADVAGRPRRAPRSEI